MGFRVVLQPSGHAFEVPQGQTVLAAGLDAGLNLPYSCRAGTCRTCRATLLSGAVEYAGEVNLDATARQGGQALLCQARPLADLLVQVQELGLHGARPKVMPARIRRIDRPTPDVAILGLRLPMNQSLLFAAGQFVDVLLEGGRTRSYSIANPPSAGGVVDLELHVRHMPGGRFTDRVFQSMREGELLRLRAPLGTFCLREHSDKPIILLASGTGFAPIRSIILHAQAIGLGRPMTLYWGNRTPQDFYAQPPEGVDCIRVVSDASWPGRTGLVHRAVMEDHPNLSGFQVYACGAPVMVDAARREFVARCGLPEGEFFADSFLTQGDNP